MSFFRYMVVSALILVTSAATQPPGLQNNGSDEAARNSDNPIQRVLEQFFVKKAKGMEMEKAIAEMASTIKNMMATIDAMKSSISSLERDIANRKEFRFNLRVSTEIKDITRTGFSINLARWGDSVLYGARVSWMACGR
ncbi:uncharacterized protein LOC133192399 [Saccostrea echinata]|uniref:uncharacterized protein LOC133192399 n=1 Tax=Saccostrea echinata TaxID=191078 RepID=UPI002A826D7E|nr:uncharacterized protein LOC133192399 [Saccostrea echinata]